LWAELKRYLAAVLVLLIVVSVFQVVSVWAQGPPDIQQKIFIHYAKSNPGKPPPGERGYYKLMGVKWQSFPVPIEANPSNPSGLSENSVLTAIHWAAEEWDSGAYSQSEGIAWYGAKPDLFADTATTTTKGYNDLAWTKDKMDGKNTIVWGDYPTSGVIAVTIVWYNAKTKTILEFDMVLDTDYPWGNATTNPNVMDLQNIATHELGHGVGLDDLYQNPAYQETMYGYSDFGKTSKRDLYIGDKQGITKLYGAVSG